MLVCVCVCVCVRVCVKTHTQLDKKLSLLSDATAIDRIVCVCVCVCVRMSVYTFEQLGECCRSWSMRRLLTRMCGVRACMCVCVHCEQLDETLSLVSDATAIDKIEDAKCKGFNSFWSIRCTLSLWCWCLCIYTLHICIYIYTYAYVYIYIHTIAIDKIEDAKCYSPFPRRWDSKSSSKGKSKSSMVKAQVSFFKWAMGKETCDDHRGFRFPFQRPFWVSSSGERAVKCWLLSTYNLFVVGLCVCKYIHALYIYTVYIYTQFIYIQRIQSIYIHTVGIYAVYTAIGMIGKNQVQRLWLLLTLL